MDHFITISIPENRFDLIGLAAVHQAQILRAVVGHTHADFTVVCVQDTDRITPGKISGEGFDSLPVMNIMVIVWMAIIGVAAIVKKLVKNESEEA